MRYSKNHEWVDMKDDVATIGITNYGKMHLGDIVNLQLPEVGKSVNAGAEVGIVESNKAAVDFHSPLSGKIIETNQKLNSNLGLLNSSPEKDGWLFKLKISDKHQYESLMSLEEYEKKVGK